MRIDSSNSKPSGLDVPAPKMPKIDPPKLDQAFVPTPKMPKIDLPKIDLSEQMVQLAQATKMPKTIVLPKLAQGFAQTLRENLRKFLPKHQLIPHTTPTCPGHVSNRFRFGCQERRDLSEEQLEWLNLIDDRIRNDESINSLSVLSLGASGRFNYGVLMIDCFGDGAVLALMAVEALTGKTTKLLKVWVEPGDFDEWAGIIRERIRKQDEKMDEDVRSAFRELLKESKE